MISVIHNAVRGRVRFKVRGLYRSSQLKHHLEALLVDDGDVSHVSANILTGNVLVRFNPESNPRRIALLIEKVALDHARGVPPRTGDASAPREHQETQRAARAVLSISEYMPPKAVKDDTDASERTAEPWHLMDKEFVLAALNSSTTHGLSTAAAKRSRERYGLNLVPEPPPRSRLGIFLDQFNSLPVALLTGAAVLSVTTAGVADAVVIMAVVGINAVIGYVTESEAEKTISSLKSLIRPYAHVIRGGEPQDVPAQQVLVGDILLLKPGTYVTADARLLDANHLSVDESVLTGESMPVTKTSARLEGSAVPLADRMNMVYSGTLITGGQGHAVVVATGIRSEMGKIQTLVAGAEAPETPIERQLSTIGDQLVVISGAICGLVFFMGLLRGNGFLQMLKTVISLAVAAVPEGLPAVATMTLALGIRNMRRHKVLIRNLDAICTLGSVQTICFDKTGTITYNRMSVQRVYSGRKRIEVGNGCGPSAEQPDEFVKLLHTCALCNETEIDRNHRQYVLNGSSTENALVELAMTCGVDVEALRQECPLLGTRYRSDEHQFMSTSHAIREGGTLVAVKGSPADVLAKCEYEIKDGERIPLTDDNRDLIENENDGMAGDALRVLGVAYAIHQNGEGSGGENGLTWLGLVGMADPIRERVKESVTAFHRAGLETVMITGDQSPTAYAVGKALGLSNGQPLEILDSTHLNSTDSAIVKALGKQVHVFSRVSPSNKLQIVQALQSSGQVVAMTGDGINDGPALKAADIGIAMGRAGTDVAREVADVVLEEDDLETLIIAISDGRTIYNNIRKTLHYLLATNFSEIQVMFVAGALGLGYPLNAMQLLWINLLSDIFPGLALALEPTEPDVMHQPPRDPLEPIVKTGDFKRITFEAATMTAASLAAYGYGIMRYGVGSAAGTLAFQSLTTSQILHALSCRSETRTLFDAEKTAPNQYLNLAIIGSLGLQMATLFVPGLRSLLGITPVTAIDGLVIGATAVAPLLVCEATKKSSEAVDEEGLHTHVRIGHRRTSRQAV